jgi:hypothetical protein
VDNAKVFIQTHIIPSEPEIEKFYADKSPIEKRDAVNRMSANLTKNDSQGVYFYRLGRLIKWGGWNGIYETNEPHGRLLRMSLHFDRSVEDYLKVDISKQLVDLPPTVGVQINNYLKVIKAEAVRRYRGEEGGKAKPKTPTASPTGGGGPTPAPTGGPTGSSTGTPLPTGGGKSKPSKGAVSPIRIVESGKQPWTRGGWGSPDQVEITPMIPSLIDLAKAITDNPTASEALSRFLGELDKKNVAKLFVDG